MEQNQTQQSTGGWFDFKNIAAIFGPDGIQTSNEVALTRQTWILLFLLIFIIFLLFVVVPRTLK
ncbi:hypothetical protein C7N43_34670 [Sphingobacteriales bacterium UPWRP_1]|nr:hypothetical protein C7N43_34670 [Sphingobacteriales bacterium UPWRP_1]